jgi:hypothetical protein
MSVDREGNAWWSGLSIASTIVVAPIVLFARLVCWLTEAVLGAVDRWRAQ